jgi:RNA polymerase sigma-70 factor (ECF subfamily)
MTAPVPPDFAEQMIAALPALRRYAMALAGQKSLADDLVQDAIERALTRAASLQSLGSMPAWLRSIVHNLYLDDLRRRRVRGVPVDMELVANDLARSAPASDATALGDVTRAMAHLSLEHRQILVLAGVEELSYREIADELALPQGTVMSRLARARAALRAVMQPGGVPGAVKEEPVRQREGAKLEMRR